MTNDQIPITNEGASHGLLEMGLSVLVVPALAKPVAHGRKAKTRGDVAGAAAAALLAPFIGHWDLVIGH
ncbi:MAG: hypothetical protein K8T25_11740 [Planctomycetia bacterium]|nr:hypothetical protein [Planctomycetia bacterium]